MSKTSNKDVLLLEEELWGFRLYEETAMIALLEFLFMACRGGLNIPTQEGEPSTPEVTAPSHLLLRAIVFYDPMLDTSKDWEEWETAFKAQFKDNGILPADWNCARLSKTFDSFERFQSIVRLIQASSDNTAAKRQWQNRFLFPWDKEQIFPDVKVNRDKAGSTLSPARNFFGHTGEIGYLLLTLSQQRQVLQNQIDQKFCRGTHPMAKICRLIENGWEDCFSVTLHKRSSYLPVNSHKDPIVLQRAEWFCEDLIALLDLNLSTEDIIDPMSRVFCLHLICYQIERAKAKTSDSRLRGNGHPLFICEAVQKQTSAVRRASRSGFQLNCKLSWQVLQENFLARFEQAASAPKGEYRVKAFSCLLPMSSAKFYSDNKAKLETDDDLESVKARLLEILAQKYERHLGIFHKELSRAIGLGSIRMTNSYRYAPDDELLLALVLATVRNEHMPFKNFLALIYEKYGLVYDDAIGKELLAGWHFETNDLANNCKRLLGQLRSLGLLHHLSDGCDYVTNPYYKAIKND